MRYVLCFDIGGTAVKAKLFDFSGRPVTERLRSLTPKPCTPKTLLALLERLVRKFEKNGAKFDCIGAGFPGVVKEGVTLTAPNLGVGWNDFSLQKAMEGRLGGAVRIANDADLQGMGVSSGEGVELVITLGTGVGSALLHDGVLVPNLELGHHPFRQGETYEEQLSKKTLHKIGPARWNRRVGKMITNLQIAFNYDVLYIGGGNAKHVTRRLPSGAHLIGNDYGLFGCVRLWAPSVRRPVGLPEASWAA